MSVRAKKNVGKILIIVLLIAICFYPFGKDVNLKNNYSETLQTSLGAFNKIIQNMNDNTYLKNRYSGKSNESTDINIRPEGVAGYYFDENGFLNLCQSQDGFFDSFYAILNSEEKAVVRIEDKKYSYLELDKVRKVLRNYCCEHIHKLAVREKFNRLDISISNIAYKSAVIEYLKNSLPAFEEDMVSFMVEKEPTALAKKLNLGGYIQGNGAGYSIACYAYDRTNKQMGILTAGHGLSSGKKLETGGLFSTVGKITHHQVEGNIDASFAPFTKQKNWLTNWSFTEPLVYNKNTMYSLKDTIYILQEGLPIHQIGVTSGFQSGYVTSASIDLSVDGYNFTDFFETDIQSAGGDSGGTIFVAYGDVNDTVKFAGVISCGSIYTYGCKAWNIHKQFDLDFVTNIWANAHLGLVVA